MTSGTLDQLVVVVARWLPPLVVVAAGAVGLLLPRKHQVRVGVRAGLALVFAALAVAHVHHLQDIAAGALLGLRAAGLAAVLPSRVLAWQPLHRLETWWESGRRSAAGVPVARG